MGFRFQGNDRIERHLLIVFRFVGGLWRKLVDPRAFQKGDVVFVGRDNGIGMYFRSFLDQAEKGLGLLLPVDDKGAVEDLVPAVFAVDLRKAEHLRIGELPADALR